MRRVMRAAWLAMMPRNFSREAGSSRAGPCSVSTKPERSERRPQLVARVGDEVGAHLGQAVLLGKIAKRDEEHRRALADASAREARDRGRDPPLHGNTLEQLDDDRLRRREGLVDGGVQRRIARHVSERLAGARLGEDLEHVTIVVKDGPCSIEGHGRLGDSFDECPPAVAVALSRAGLPPRPLPAVVAIRAVADAMGDNCRCRDDDE